MSHNEPRTCPRCGIFYYEWLQRDWKSMFTPGAEVPEQLIPNIHECPEPYPREMAEMIATLYSRTRAPMSRRMRARVRLGLAPSEDTHHA